ncbi:MAG: hypothetical protein H0U82_01745 [Actinobacteria bacterium]|nr:hypothetical protein [Actinomycetota bacterium]
MVRQRTAKLVIAFALIAVLAVPAWAARGVVADLFDLSNPGQPVAETDPGFDELSWVREHGVTSDIKLLAEQDGIRFFVARREGRTCYFVSYVVTAPPRGVQLHCPERYGPSDFPSRDEPILDMSWVRGFEKDLSGAHLKRLSGFAADGVARVGLRTLDGQEHFTPVVKNVYAESDPPEAPVTDIVVQDAEGKTIYSQPLP